MRKAELLRAIEHEFGPLGRVLMEDQVLEELGGSTARQALDAGVAPRRVWLALCVVNDVPRERWAGVGLAHPKENP